MNDAFLENQTPAVKVIHGGRLARQLRQLHASARSLLAYELAAGEKVLTQPTRSQAALLLGVSVASVAAIARARRPNCARPSMSDAALERLIVREESRGSLRRSIV